MSKAVINPEAVSSLSEAIANINRYRYEIPETFDTTYLTSVVAIRRGATIVAKVTIKAGATADWHGGINTGLSSAFRPATGVFGSYRVNASADITKNIIAELGTDGNIQFLPSAVFNADIPFTFTYISAVD